MTRLVDVYDLPDWALSALARARLRTPADVLLRAACGRYGCAADGGFAAVTAQMLWDLTGFSRPWAECVDAARVLVAAAQATEGV